MMEGYLNFNGKMLNIVEPWGNYSCIVKVQGCKVQGGNGLRIVSCQITTLAEWI